MREVPGSIPGTALLLRGLFAHTAASASRCVGGLYHIVTAWRELRIRTVGARGLRDGLTLHQRKHRGLKIPQRSLPVLLHMHPVARGFGALSPDTVSASRKTRRVRLSHQMILGGPCD